MSELEHSSEELKKLGITTIDHAINSVSDGGELITFCMVDNKGKISLNRFIADTFEEQIFRARQVLKTIPGDRFALACGAFLTIEDGRYDAVLVEIYESGRPKGVKLCQAYIPKTKKTAFREVGSMRHLGDCEPLV